MERNRGKKSTKKKSFPSFIILKDCFKPYMFVLSLLTNSLPLRKENLVTLSVLLNLLIMVYI